MCDEQKSISGTTACKAVRWIGYSSTRPYLVCQESKARLSTGFKITFPLILFDVNIN